MMPFRNRSEAGQRLAERLSLLKLDAAVVLALPRGGVPVAIEAARLLMVPLDLFVVRKISAPGHPELAIGAVVEGHPHTVLVDEKVARLAGADSVYVEHKIRMERLEVERQIQVFRGGRPRLDIRGKTAVIVDDGIATSLTARAVLQAARRLEPASVVFATPVAPEATVQELRSLVDEVVCLREAPNFDAVGSFYRDFRQVSDDQVIALLSHACQCDGTWAH
jgi:putative phosphoribosyl transferase